MSQLAEWKDFYVIVGSAAAVLIGLQFVVVTLVPSKPVETSPELGSAVATPTIVHFGSVLLLAALVAAPWDSIGVAGVIWALVGLAGIAYMVFVVRRFRVQGEYEPVFEDWLFHIFLPFLAYAVLSASAFAVFANERTGLFGIAAAVLLLLFVGIHNAWDSIVYLVFVRK